MSRHYAVLGGAGFIGSHFVDHLLSHGNRVSVIDNLCSGTEERISHHYGSDSFSFERMDIENTDQLAPALRGVDTVIHLASNPDIAKAAREPRIDFVQGTVLTESVAEASRLSGVPQIIYASGSGVYEENPSQDLDENSPLLPISTYGASKLSGEALLAAYSYMFDIQITCFRFANVVGSRQTHGVGYDFLRKLQRDPKNLQVMGDGTQSKSYIYVDDVVKGALLASRTTVKQFDVFNISTGDNISVKDIVLAAIRASGLTLEQVKVMYAHSNRGWKGDVPMIRLNSDKLRSLGWSNSRSSLEAMKESLEFLKLEM